MWQLLRDNRNFRRLISAHAQSQLGSGAAYVALVLIAYERLRGGWGVSLVLLSDFLPGVVLSPYFGALADRYNRKRLAIGGDLIRALAFGAVALTSAYWVLIPLTLLAGVGSSAWRPAINATLPRLVADEDRSAASAAYSGCMTLGMTLGPALGALVLLFTTPEWLLGANALSFLASALIIATVEFPAREHDPAISPSTALRRPAAARGGLFATINAVRRLPQIPTIIVISALGVLTSALINVAEPIFAESTLHSGQDGYSLLVAIYGVGALVGTMFNARLPSSVFALRRIWALGVLVYGITMAATGMMEVWLLAAVTFLFTGVANALAVGPAYRLLQELIPDSLLGRAFGLRDWLSNGAYVAAFVAAGALEASLGPRGLFYLAGGGTFAIGLWAAAWSLRPVRKIELDSSQDAGLSAIDNDESSTLTVA